MKSRPAQERASLDEELCATVFRSFFPRVGLHISLLDSCHMPLTYDDSSLLTLSGCYVVSEFLCWSSILRIRMLQLFSQSWARGMSRLTFNARVSLPTPSHKWLLPYFSSHIQNLPSKSSYKNSSFSLILIFAHNWSLHFRKVSTTYLIHSHTLLR